VCAVGVVVEERGEEGSAGVGGGGGGCAK